jgi:hypothetical protein
MTLDASGNLALGTTNVGYGKFGVYDASNTLIGIANSTSYAQLQQNGADLYINTNLGGAAGGNLIFRFGSGATERLRITSGGNLLVGTTSDGGQKLQVNGTGLFTDILTLRTGTNGYNGEITLGSNAANRGRIYYDGDINGQLIFQNTYDSTNTNSGILFQTRTAGTAVNALKISGSGIINLANVPSSATGLSSGDIYKDASGFLKIV